MRRLLAFAICGLGLAACTSGDLGKLDSGQVTLQLESEPPGADATVSTGATCKTPCSVPLSNSVGEVTVTFALEGYVPQEAAVQVVQSLDPREAPARAVPNPVKVDLVAAPKPKPPARRRPARRPTAAKPAPKPAASRPAARRPATRRAAPAQPASQPAAAEPPPSSAPAPAAAQSAPWPAPQPQPAPAQSSPWPSAPPPQQ